MFQKMDCDEPHKAIGPRLGPSAGDHGTDDQVAVNQNGAARNNPEIASGSPATRSYPSRPITLCRSHKHKPSAQGAVTSMWVTISLA